MKLSPARLYSSSVGVKPLTTLTEDELALKDSGKFIHIMIDEMMKKKIYKLRRLYISHCEPLKTTHIFLFIQDYRISHKTN
jgi:hypothetical protein